MPEEEQTILLCSFPSCKTRLQGKVGELAMDLPRECENLIHCAQSAGFDLCIL